MPEAAVQSTLEAETSGRPALRVARIAGLGHHVPARVVHNSELAERFGVDDEWIVRRTGIHSRRWAAEDEGLDDMAVAAGARALEDAGMDAADVDLVLVATVSQDQLIPNSAPVVASRLGAARAGAIDIGAACTGWLSALTLAAAQVEAGRASTVLVIGADRLSSFLDLDDPKTSALFGDGAGAVVVSAEGERSDGEGPARARGTGIGPIALEADGELADRLFATREDGHIRMDGHSTYQVAVKHLTAITLEVCDRAGVELDDIDLFVYHQANGRIIRAVGERLGAPTERVADYVAGMANTSAASVPLALSMLREDGRLRIGQRVLVAAMGAGFVWGAGLLEWGIG
jgi:3-oxoacyl-[acyl-carrier-protein] synthase-3